MSCMSGLNPGLRAPAIDYAEPQGDTSSGAVGSFFPSAMKIFSVGPSGDKRGYSNVMA